MPHVAVIIVNYNGEQDTVECVQSLQKITHKLFQFSTVIVDNGSKEALTLPEELMKPDIVVLRSDANLGFTSGNNLGISYALEHFSSDYILLLNNDTTVDPQFLTQMLECAQKNERVGIVTPKIYFSADREYHHDSYEKSQRGHVFWYAGGSIDWRNFDALHRGIDEVDIGQFDVQTESDFATGCCALIPRHVIEEVGMFDAKYFLYMEDVDLSVRIRGRGYRIFFCSDAKIWHKNAGSSGGAGSKLHQYYQTRNRLFFFTKYHNPEPSSASLFTSVRPYVTMTKYTLRLLLFGTNIERRAVLDWFIGRMGKQTVL